MASPFAYKLESLCARGSLEMGEMDAMVATQPRLLIQTHHQRSHRTQLHSKFKSFPQALQVCESESKLVEVVKRTYQLLLLCFPFLLLLPPSLFLLLLLIPLVVYGALLRLHKHKTLELENSKSQTCEDLA